MIVSAQNIDGIGRFGIVSVVNDNVEQFFRRELLAWLPTRKAPGIGSGHDNVERCCRPTVADRKTGIDGGCCRRFLQTAKLWFGAWGHQRSRIQHVRRRSYNGPDK
jgi:hypothetical protein